MKLSAAMFLGLSLPTLLASPAWAEEPIDTVQSIIQSQIAAFLNHDAKSAYAFASPSVRDRFPTEDAFFDMVKKNYAPVFRPGHVAFGRSKVQGDTVVQEVLISGPGGKDWTAFYQLVKQPDGSYKINGVHMVHAAPGPEI